MSITPLNTSHIIVPFFIYLLQIRCDFKACFCWDSLGFRITKIPGGGAGFDPTPPICLIQTLTHIMLHNMKQHIKHTYPAWNTLSCLHLLDFWLDSAPVGEAGPGTTIPHQCFVQQEGGTCASACCRRNSDHSGLFPQKVWSKSCRYLQLYLYLLLNFSNEIW